MPNCDPIEVSILNGGSICYHMSQKANSVVVCLWFISYSVEWRTNVPVVPSRHSSHFSTLSFTWMYNSQLVYYFLQCFMITETFAWKLSMPAQRGPHQITLRAMFWSLKAYPKQPIAGKGCTKVRRRLSKFFYWHPLPSVRAFFAILWKPILKNLSGFRNVRMWPQSKIQLLIK